jgi:hypothetical protein
MQYALKRMLNVPKNMAGLRYVPTGRTFEIAKRAAADAARGNVEVAAKISAARKGQKLSEEHKKKIGASLQGTVKSQAAKDASREKQIGKPKSPEACEKMRLAWIARRERKAAGLESRAAYSEQALANMKAAAVKRGEQQRAARALNKGSQI